MRLTSFLILVFCALLANAAQVQTPRAKLIDWDRILDTWRIGDYDFGGRKVPRDLKDNLRYHFGKDAVFEMRMNGEKKPLVAGTFMLDSAAKLKAIDLIDRDKNSMLGLYEFDGDKLKLCMAQKAGNRRPMEIKSDGKVYIVVTLVRVKEEKESGKK